MSQIYEFTIELLEDTHIGTGVGNHLVDSFNTTDEQGYPVIWRQHLKGILREAANEWVELGEAVGVEENRQKISETLFGASNQNRNQGCLTLYSAYIEGSQNQSPEQFFINLSSTALGKKTDRNSDGLFNRAAQKGSLRTKQYVRAGTKFSCEYQLFGEFSAEEEARLNNAMQSILKRMYALGSQKNRATGAIKIIHKGSKTHEDKALNLSMADAPAFINLTLEALEPLRLPATNKPGNLVTTETFIDGNKLLGAFANWCKQHQQNGCFQAIINGQISFGYAYPVSNLKDVENDISFPLPQNYRAPKVGLNNKGEAESVDQHLPWWLQKTKPIPKEPIKDEKLKRLSTGHYVSLNTSDPNNWHLSKQSTSLHMRNDISKHDLFTEETVPKGTRFQCQLLISNSDVRKQFIETILTPVYQQGQPLLIGRGGAPVKVTLAKALPLEQMLPTVNDKTSRYTLVTTSPWLIYNPQLQPETKLTPKVLDEAFGLGTCLQDAFEEGKTLTQSQTTLISGFNPASGLPKRTETAIASGSMIRFEIENESQNQNQRKAINALLDKLNTSPAVGQKQAQGLGRFYVYTESPELEWSNGNHSSSNICSFYSQREQIYQQVDAIWPGFVKALNQVSKSKQPSKQQWQQLRQKFRQVEYAHNQQPEQKQEDVHKQAIANIFKQFVERKVNNNPWEAISTALELWKNAIQSKDIGEQLTYSLYLFDKIWLSLTTTTENIPQSNKEEEGAK